MQCLAQRTLCRILVPRVRRTNGHVVQKAEALTSSTAKRIQFARTPRRHPPCPRCPPPQAPRRRCRLVSARPTRRLRLSVQKGPSVPHPNSPGDVLAASLQATHATTQGEQEKIGLCDILLGAFEKAAAKQRPSCSPAQKALTAAPLQTASTAAMTVPAARVAASQLSAVTGVSRSAKV